MSTKTTSDKYHIKKLDNEGHNYLTWAIHCQMVLEDLNIWSVINPELTLPIPVTIGSPIVQIYSQVADLGSACKLAPQSLGLPQTERLSMRVLKSILKLREVSPLAWELYTVSRKGQVTKHK